MTQEDKELLLKDLCARLPYGVKCRFETTVDTYKTIELSREGTNGILVDFDELYCYWFNEGFIIPYLRSMSNMTEKEKEELKYEIELELQALEGDEGHSTVSAAPAAFEIDFYNKHHLDYRGLIDKGLALEAPDGMYN